MKILNIKYLIVHEDHVGQRIDNFLHCYLKRVPKSRIYRLLRTGKILINKKKTQAKYKLINGDKIELPSIYISASKEKISPKLNKIAGLTNQIIFEDNYLLIINKPSGLAVHGGTKLSFGLIEALRILQPNKKFLELVHRLDRDTSGILLIAQKRATLRLLHQQLRNQEIKKEYLALVHGRWPANFDKIELPIIKNNYSKFHRISISLNKNTKNAETHFRIKKYFQNTTLLQVQPITGRTHQIRIHTSYLGYPIAFDKRYGNNDLDKQLVTSGLKRLFLHSYSISFRHPNNGNYIKLKAPLDNNLKQCLNYLESKN